MPSEGEEIVINVDSKRLAVLGIIIGFTALSLTSYMVALSAFVSPSQEFRFKGNVQNITDYYFNLDTTFSAGETVRIVGIVLYADQYWDPPTYYFFTTTTTIKWIVTIKDANDMPIHFTYGTITGAGLSDEELPQVSFDLPGTAASGNYTIRVMAWSGWLPSGDTLTIAVLEDTFTVA